MELSHLAQLHIIWMWMHPFLEVSAHALLQVATKGKKSKTVEFLGNFAKRRSATKVNWLFFIILEPSYLIQAHTFWKLVHVHFSVHIILVAIRGSE